MQIHRLKRMAMYLWPYKFHVIAILLSGAFFGAVNAGLAGLAGFAINVAKWSPQDGPITKLLPERVQANGWVMDFLKNQDMDITQHSMFVLTLIVLLGLMLLLSTGVFLQNVLPELLTNRITINLRNRIGRHLLNLDFSFFREKRSGELLSRLTGDLAQLGNAMLLIGVFLTRPLSLLILLYFLFTLNWKLTLMGMLGLPLTALMLSFLFRKLRDISRQVQVQAANVTDTMVQFLAGISTVKAYGCEEFELKNFAAENDNYFRKIVRCIIMNNLERPITSLTGKIGMLVVLYFGGKMVMDNTIPADMLTSFVAALMLMYSPAKDISRANANFQVYLAGAERVFDLLETDAKIVEGTREISQLNDRISFEQVNFCYVPDNPVVRDFCLEIKRGETVALVGQSGCGKTTLVHLLLRLYDTTSGRISIDGVDIRELTFASLRGKIALVSQNPFLFNSSIRDNIAYGMADARNDDIISAARAANIHDDIMKMPHGYETRVGDRGESLSGGQRQRIAIARAVFKNPPILLLDEATSALDSENERKVQQALEELQQNRTSIVIAHRLSTIRNADRIVMMKDGRILGIGAHEELKASCPDYANLVLLQQW